MKNFFERNHGAINRQLIRILKKEEGRHFALPAFVHFALPHLRERVLEIGSLQVPYEKSIRPQEKRVIVPAGFAQCAEHFWPHFAMPGFIFFELLWPDV